MTQQPAEVSVVSEGKEWDCGDSDHEDAPDQALRERHESAVFEQREKRLSLSHEMLQKETMLGDAEVHVVPENGEWADGKDSDDESPSKLRERHESTAFELREKRLSFAAESLEKATMIGDADVNVVDSAEWAEGQDSDDDNKENHENAVFASREKRLSFGAEALKTGLVIGDVDVQVVQQNGEWAEGQDSDEDDGKREKHESGVFEARERRLTEGTEALQKESMLGDVEVHVQQSTEWAEENDSGQEDSPTKKRERFESDSFAAREKRLSLSASALEQAKILGDAEVNVVNESAEWAEGGDSDDELKQDEHEASVFVARERRLTASAEALQSAANISDADMQAANAQ